MKFLAIVYGVRRVFLAYYYNYSIFLTKIKEIYIIKPQTRVLLKRPSQTSNYTKSTKSPKLLCFGDFNVQPYSLSTYMTYCCDCLIIYSPSTFANSTGTALPICMPISCILP